MYRTRGTELLGLSTPDCRKSVLPALVSHAGPSGVATNSLCVNDADIASHIEQLVAEEHRLLERGEAGTMVAADHERLADVNVQLDRYYDLLRQRRARREAGQSPTDSAIRSEETVERYLQ